MYTIELVATAAQSTDGGLNLAEILSDLPTDPASIFVGLLLLGSLGLVIWSGRGKGKGKGGTPA